jgi:cobalt/nickel transport system permease protein
VGKCVKYVQRAKLWLGLYLAAIVVITLVHEPIVLGSILCLAVAAAGGGRWKLLRRTFLAVISFNLTVSLGYLIVASWQGTFTPDYLLLVNLRVVLLVFLGFWFVSAVDVLAALAGWPLARLLATLAIGQIKTFERVLRDFRLAFESRNLTQPRLIDKARSAVAQTQTLLDKSIASANDAAMAMRSRGAFDD